MTPGAWFLAACAVAAIAMAGVATVRVALLARSVKLRGDEIKSLPWLDKERLQRAATRLQNDVEGIAPLVERSRRAIERIQAAGTTLRLPEAALAVRIAILTFAALRRS